MMRAFITLWFTIVSLLGPGLCCCTARAARAAMHDPPATCDRPVEACPHCASNAAPATPGEQPADPGRSAPCPCKQGQSAPPATTAPQSAELGEWLRLAVVDLAGALPVTGAGLTPVAADPGGPPPARAPFVSSDSLLRVFHLLRC
jgi:hypothetical protein